MSRKSSKFGFSAFQVAAARTYVDSSLEIMARYGSAPKMTPERYNKLLADVLACIPIHLRIPKAAQDSTPLEEQ